jgi:hypothetical protein
MKRPTEETRHWSQGQLQTYHDGELGEIEVERLKNHLAVCARCQALAAALFARADRLQDQLAILDPQAAESPAPARVARSRLEAYKSKKEKIPMFNKLFTRNFRPFWAILAIIAVLAISLTIPQVRAIANSFLGLFRVEQVAVVPVNLVDLPNNFSNAGPSIMQLFSDNLKVEEMGEAQDVATAVEASALVGIPVRLPTGIEGTPKLSVQPGMHLSFKVDLPRIRSILQEAGFGDMQLPSNLDGATVDADLPASVTALYGACKSDQAVSAPGEDPDEMGGWGVNCTALVQLPSPTINAPEGLDVAAIGKAFLQMTGMSAEEADAFSQTVDWSTTLVIPVPSFTSHQTVTVDGVNGVLIQQDPNYAQSMYILIWAKDGIVYALAGYGNSSSALAIANSLK